MENDNIRFVATNMRGKNDSRVYYAKIGDQVVGHYLGWYNGNVIKLYRYDGDDSWCPNRLNLAPEEVARA